VARPEYHHAVDKDVRSGYRSGIAGRQVPGQPLPDRGEQVCDTTTFRGGNYATPHPQYYYNTSIAPERAPDQPALNHRTIIVSGVLAADCQHVMQQFFREKRENAEKAGWRSNQERPPRQRIHGVTRRNARRDHVR
jgi:hypothetical protein